MDQMMAALATVLAHRFPGRVIDLDYDDEVWTLKLEGVAYTFQVGSDDDAFIFVAPGQSPIIVDLDALGIDWEATS